MNTIEQLLTTRWKRTFFFILLSAIFLSVASITYDQFHLLPPKWVGYVTALFCLSVIVYFFMDRFFSSGKKIQKIVFASIVLGITGPFFSWVIVFFVFALFYGV